MCSSSRFNNDLVEIASENAVVRTRGIEIVPRNTSICAYDNLNHNESDSKEMEKQIRAISFLIHKDCSYSSIR